MSKQSLLLVDGDTRSLRVLEVSLRKAGFSVTPAVSVGDALDKLEISAPDLIISETKFATELDGFELRRRLRNTPDWKDIPFIFLTAETAIENKIKGLELGVDDYLTKPIYIKEIVTRINILLQKRQRQFLDLKKDGTRFAGRVADMPVVDVIQTIEVSRKSGVIQFSGGPGRQAAIYFRDGKVIDAEAGTLQGEDAVYRLLTWNEGEFEVEFRTVRRREAITTSSQGLLMEGMRRLDEWSRLLEQLPPLTHRFEIDAAELSTRLGEIPDDNNRILRLFDGKRTLLEVIDASDFGDLECLQAISRLYFEGLLIDLDPGQRTKRDTGKPVPLTIVEGVPFTPIEEVVSGPIDIAGLNARSRDSDRDLAQDTTAPAEDLRTTQPEQEVAAHDQSLPTGAQTSTPVDEPMAAEPVAAEPVAAEPHAAEEEPQRMRRPSSQLIEDTDVVEEEEDIRGPLMGGYRPSSLRLIDEAIAAAHAIEPSLFEPEELAAAGVTPAPAAEPAPSPPEETPLARIKMRSSDPRIENARDLVEKSPAYEEPAPTPTNGEPRERPSRPSKRITQPPPIPSKVKELRELTKQEIEDAPLLDVDPYTSGEHRVPSEAELAAAAELADAPFVDVDPYTSGEIPVTPALVAVIKQADEEDSGGVPRTIEADDSSELADEGPTDPSRRRFANTIRRDDSQQLKMIGSHGKDRAEASGELRMPQNSMGELGEPQRELVTILPRRITREIAVQNVPAGGADVKPVEAEAKSDEAAKDVEATEAKKADVKADVKPGKPAIEPPPRPVPRRTPAEGSGVVRKSGPGRGATILLVLAAVIAGAALVSWLRKPKVTSQPVATVDDAPLVAEAPDAAEFHGFGVDAAVAMTPVDATVAMTPPVDATVAMAPPDAAVRPDAAVIVVAPRDAGTVAVATADAGVDKNKEAKALYDKGHAALEDGDPETALDLLDQSLKLRKTARTYLERARALQRMQRIDEAVASVDDAIKMNQSHAPAWEQKGMILWSAQRYGEARPALEKYLELDPEGRKAPMIRAMLDEQK